MTTSLGRGLALLFGLGILAEGASCSLVVQRDGVQCKIDTDCTARGAEFALSKCDTTTNVCVAACNVNADCKTQPAVCRASQCVELLSKECDRTLPVLGPGQSVDDNAILLGGLFSLQGTNASSGVARVNSVQLAMENVARDVVGLPNGTAGGKPRPLFAVVCTDTDAANMDVSQTAAQHLVDIGASAIMGPGSSGLVLNVAKNITVPKNEFLITPSATTTQLTGLSPLVWRTAPSDEIQSRALSASVSELEAKYRVDNAIMMATPIKLAIVYKNDSYGGDLFKLVAGNAKINNLPVTDAANTMNYKGIQFDPTMDLSSVVTDLVNFKPNLIALFGTTEVVTKILQPVEMAWPMMVLRPAYLISDGGRKQELLDAVKGNDPLRLRIRGTVPGVSENVNQLFKLFRLGYQSKFQSTMACPNMVCPDIFGMAGAYDSVYLLTLAMASVGAKPIDGPGIAAGMTKMTGGVKFQIGMDKLQDAINSIAAGKALDVDGASGPLNFDNTAHEAPSDIQVWCVSNGDFYTTGRYYNATTQVMSGVFSCP